MEYKQKPYRNLRLKYPFLTIAGLALAVFLLGIGIAAIFGARDTSLTLSDGEEIRFTGLFDKDGKPTKVPELICETEAEKADYEAGMARRAHRHRNQLY